jgi:hypothetical protein
MQNLIIHIEVKPTTNTVDTKVKNAVLSIAQLIKDKHL